MSTGHHYSPQLSFAVYDITYVCVNWVSQLPASSLGTRLAVSTSCQSVPMYPQGESKT